MFVANNFIPSTPTDDDTAARSLRFAAWRLNEVADALEEGQPLSALPLLQDILLAEAKIAEAFRTLDRNTREAAVQHVWGRPIRGSVS